MKSVSCNLLKVILDTTFVQEDLLQAPDHGRSNLCHFGITVITGETFKLNLGLFTCQSRADVAYFKHDYTNPKKSIW